MCFFFKFGKHCLAVNGSFKSFKVQVQKSQTFFRIIRYLKQLVDQQVLIDRGSHLSYEQCVAGVLRRLVCLGMPCMHGMSHLMRQCRYTVQRACKVRQDIRVGIVCA